MTEHSNKVLKILGHDFIVLFYQHHFKTYQTTSKLEQRTKWFMSHKPNIMSDVAARRKTFLKWPGIHKQQKNTYKPVH